MSESSSVELLDYELAREIAVGYAAQGIIKLNNLFGEEIITPDALLESEFQEKGEDLRQTGEVFRRMGAVGLNPVVVCYPRDLDEYEWDALLTGHEYTDPNETEGFSSVSRGFAHILTRLDRAKFAFAPEWTTSIITAHSTAPDQDYGEYTLGTVEEYVALTWQMLLRKVMPIDSETTALLKGVNRSRFYADWDGYKASVSVRQAPEGTIVSDPRIIPRLSYYSGIK